MKDPAYMAEMQRLMLELRPQTGAHVDAVVRAVYAAPPDIVKLAADAIKTAR